MQPTKRILFQFDPDPHPSSFDAVVALDAGVDQLLQYSNVEAADVRQLVYGAIFTRSIEKLRNTAIFIGGSDVGHGEALLKQVIDAFLDPMRVSVMLDSSGANTTAAAAVWCAQRHLDLKSTTAVVLAGTGPVGGRAARLLLRAGANVRVGSRQLHRSKAAVEKISAAAGEAEPARITAVQTNTHDELAEALAGANLVLAAGAAGSQLLPRSIRTAAPSVQVVVDLNAVPPAGIEGINVTARGDRIDNVIGYGAVGVGGFKMKIHKALVGRLFTRNDLVLDAEEAWDVANEFDIA